jgi:hypothetical protein
MLWNDPLEVAAHRASALKNWNRSSAQSKGLTAREDQLLRLQQGLQLLINSNTGYPQPSPERLVAAAEWLLDFFGAAS